MNYSTFKQDYLPIIGAIGFSISLAAFVGYQVKKSTQPVELPRSQNTLERLVDVPENLFEVK